MKNSPVVALLAVAVPLLTASCQCSRSPHSGRSQALTERSYRLPNGLAVDLAAGPCGDSAAVVVIVAGGVDADPPGRSGMAHLAEHLLAVAPAGRAERAVETGTDYTLYSVAVTGDRLLAEFDEVAAWMRTAPTEADLSRARASVLEELARLSGSDAPLTAMSLAEEAVQPTPYNGKRRGVASEVQAITLAELQAFWQARFKPGNARIAIAGRFDAEKVVARVEADFATLAAGTPPVPREASGARVRGTLVMGNAPAAVAVAVPAPPEDSPLYPAFLVLSARLMEKPAPARAWQAHYDPLRRPELLFLTAPLEQGEAPEPAAAHLRTEAAAIMSRPPAPGDAAAARERFSLFLEPQLVDPALCAKDARALAVARARRAQLRLAGAPLAQALETITKEQLGEAAGLFDSKQTAAVIAGGALR